jgi:hypothetical protein
MSTSVCGTNGKTATVFKINESLRASELELYRKRIFFLAKSQNKAKFLKNVRTGT